MPPPRIEIQFVGQNGEECSRRVKAKYEEDGVTVRELHKAFDELFRLLPAEEWANSDVVAGFRTILGLSKNKALKMPPKGFSGNGKNIARLSAKFNLNGVEYRLEVDNYTGHNLRMLKWGQGKETQQES